MSGIAARSLGSYPFSEIRGLREFVVVTVTAEPPSAGKVLLLTGGPIYAIPYAYARYRLERGPNTVFSDYFGLHSTPVAIPVLPSNGPVAKFVEVDVAPGFAVSQVQVTI